MATPSLLEAPFVRTTGRLRDSLRRSFVLAIAAALFAAIGVGPGQATTDALSPAALPSLLQSYGDELAKVSSDAEAQTLFIASIGPALGLQDVVQTLNAKSIPAKLAKELLVPEITESARKLVAALAIWQWAETVSPDQPAQVPRLAWLQTAGGVAALTPLLQQPEAAGHEFYRSVHRVAMEASQVATSEWWQLKTWKDRVRAIRGRNRLCGTWQWTIHNHQQHHQEQKLSLIFPPPGPNRPVAAGLVETVVLGENVYLRWEVNGQIQEDSLQFTKDGQRLEGTFVNSHGGWGSITGKRTADCQGDAK
jgi:hypothetical protein